MDLRELLSVNIKRFLTPLVSFGASVNIKRFLTPLVPLVPFGSPDPFGSNQIVMFSESTGKK
jgi:hypothetical protein